MKKLLLFVIIIFSLLACTKEENNAPPNRLPDITTTGANTFGCMINGELWIPKVEGKNFDEIEADYYSPIQEISIIGRKRTKDREIDQRITLYKTFVSQDTFDFNNYNLGTKFTNIHCGSYYIDSLEFSQLIISRLDLENKIISGTFEFTAVREDEDCELEKVHVTEGRFDMKLGVF